MTITVLPISQLGAADPLDGTEQVPLNQGGNTKRSTPDAFVTLASGVIIPVAVAQAAGYTDSKFPVANASLANMIQATVKGRAAGAGTGIPQDLTQAQLTALVNLFTTLLPGAVPASGGGTTNFLRADGTWAPAGGGGGVSTGSFLGTLSGVTPALTPTVNYTIAGDIAFLWIDTAATDTSDGNPLRLSGIDVAVRPSDDLVTPCVLWATNTGPATFYEGAAQYSVANTRFDFYVKTIDGGFMIFDTANALSFGGAIGLPAGWMISYPLT